ncbi:MAG: DUF1156 domain-containing protein, partial [Chloroflexia bacterium]|nr:DUF1156 domain-containing protein [Chloroflexia bacterium]
VAKAVGAGKPWACETVDFSDPDRPPTCIEVDFPIIPINEIAAIEDNAGKPIYQMSKWWARRRSSVFRAMLLASAIKAPDDPAEAAKLVWDAYYGNHQKGTRRTPDLAQDPRGRYPDPQRRRGRHESLSNLGGEEPNGRQTVGSLRSAGRGGGLMAPVERLHV